MRSAAVLLLACALLAAPGRAEDPPAPEVAARAWLRKAVDGPDWAKVGAAQANARGKRIVAESLLRFLDVLMTPESPGSGAARPGDAPAAARSGEPGDVLLESFAGWTETLSAVPAIETSVRAGVATPALRRIVARLPDIQNAEGGWSHGAAIGADFYPTTLVVTTNLALFALGMARICDAPADDDSIRRGVALLADVQAPSGAMPYGGRVYRKGYEAGRTAGSVLALLACDADAERCRRSARYLAGNVASIPDGHASGALHVFVGALACRTLGETVWKEYDTKVLGRVRAAQRADGSFDDLLGNSPDSMRLLSDDTTNRAYITALYAAALAVPRSRIPAALSSRVARLGTIAPPHGADPAPQPPRRWAAALPGRAADVALLPDAVVAGTLDGRLAFLARIDGALRSESRPGETHPSLAGPLHLRATNCGVLAIGIPDEAPRIAGAGGRAGDAREGGARLAHWNGAGKLGWTTALPHGTPTVEPSGECVNLYLRSGSVRSLAALDGRVVAEVSADPPFVNAPLLALGGGALVAGRESRLTRIEPDGVERWSRRTPARGGVVPPAWTSLATARDAVFAGSTDGTVAEFDAATGVPRRRIDAGGGIVAIDVATFGPADPPVVVAALGDGRVVGISDGRVTWTADVGRGREGAHGPALRLRGGVVWTGGSAYGRVVRLDPRDGRILVQVPLAADARWDADESGIAVADGSGVRLYAASP